MINAAICFIVIALIAWLFVDMYYLYDNIVCSFRRLGLDFTLLILGVSCLDVQLLGHFLNSPWVSNKTTYNLSIMVTVV